MDTDVATPLTDYNTLGIAASCKRLLVARQPAQLIQFCLTAFANKEPLLVIGAGSNLVFTQYFDGTVVVVQTKGIVVDQDESYYRLTVNAGENWHELVKFCLTNGMYGLENLALIPGSAGAAPIQNIGAYGVEFSQYCDWVEYLDLETGDRQRLDNHECQFGYRDSVFKNQLRKNAIVVRVGLKLPKRWRANLSYGPLQSLDATTATAATVYKTVCAARAAKLPDPTQLGNAGSFFKNPLISQHQFTQLQSSFADIVGYRVDDDKVKLAAAWLIDNCGLKGTAIGGAAIHDNQALVIVNRDNATGRDVCRLACHVKQLVARRFAVNLQVEPTIIGSTGPQDIDNA